MGTITVNVTDETESLFREAVEERLGKQKGALGRALDEAMKTWAQEKLQNEIAERQLLLMKKGFSLGFNNKKILRDELHDRSN